MPAHEKVGLALSAEQCTRARMGALLLVALHTFDPAQLSTEWTNSHSRGQWMHATKLSPLNATPFTRYVVSYPRCRVSSPPAV